MKTFEYFKQENNIDSWVVTTTDSRFITFDSPIKTYKKEVNDYHNAMLEKVLIDLDYTSIGEVQLWLVGEFAEEANSIIEWWKSTSMLLLEHFETITEYKDTSIFCATIPKFI